ncbi:MAG: protein translocase subunit SecD [Candidatus Eisenbacteria bacterium]|uniref:Protein translocase subunit SecD n=1 Tax=Eiseniibacteriota bacterium TaxID=2212470 RepID=A0A937X5P1_UNCEI|nr:protein translocase subunit SecD [Candidatus Eisenbacteria bacterium]
MGGNFRWKVTILIALVALSVYALLPTLRYYTMGEADRDALSPDKLAELRENALKLGLDLQGGMHLVLELDRTALRDTEVRDAMDRVMQILRNRVDRFGVAEPTIQRQGEDRIVVELPGLLDKERALSLIGQTAMLEFKLVKTEQDARRVFERLDQKLAAQPGAEADSAAIEFLRPLTDLMPFWPELPLGGGFIPESEVPTAQALLDQLDLENLLPIDTELQWGRSTETYQGYTGRLLYVLDRKARLGGAHVASAIRRIGLDAARPNSSGVSLTLNPEGSRVFRRVTGENVGRMLAITLDGRVASAPSIRERIPGGRASITGNFTDEEARDLAIVLQAGALPAPIHIIHDMTVGPSLGADSIRKGTTAVAVAAIAVVCFMIFYYRGSGLIAILALILNMLFLLAALAGMRATLTLPGLAGMALTVGIAVDANVLIFERIREEMRAGKKVRSAIEAGFARAFKTILDANVTTMISSGVLWWIATGPIQGFATTLFIGVLANLYTAVLVSRMVFDIWTSRRERETLSI